LFNAERGLLPVQGAALAAKQAGDKTTALALMRAIKVCDNMLQDQKAGGYVDMAALPKLE
jgi:hypothetical protein